MSEIPGGRASQIFRLDDRGLFRQRKEKLVRQFALIPLLLLTGVASADADASKRNCPHQVVLEVELGEETVSLAVHEGGLATLADSASELALGIVARVTGPTSAELEIVELVGDSPKTWRRGETIQRLQGMVGFQSATSAPGRPIMIRVQAIEEASAAPAGLQSCAVLCGSIRGSGQRVVMTCGSCDA